MIKTDNNTKGSKSLLVIWFAGIIGLLDSVYLTFIKFTKIPIYCTPGLGHCDVVNSSQWSVLWGIPIAIFGVAAFGALVLTLALKDRIDWIGKYHNLILFGISFAGFLFSVYLTYIELFILRAICQWCLLSAISISAILIATIIRLDLRSTMSLKRGGN